MLAETLHDISILEYFKSPFCTEKVEEFRTLQNPSRIIRGMKLKDKLIVNICHQSETYAPRSPVEPEKNLLLATVLRALNDLTANTHSKYKQDAINWFLGTEAPEEGEADPYFTFEHCASHLKFSAGQVNFLKNKALEIRLGYEKEKAQDS